MTPSPYLKRHPNARGKTIAWIQTRDTMTAKLAAETKAARKPKDEPVVGQAALYDCSVWIRANTLGAAILGIS